MGSASRALNNAADVTPEIRERILSAARALNYTRLRRRSVRPVNGHGTVAANVAVVCFGMEDALVQLPSVSTAIHAVEEAVSAEGGMFMFASIPRGDRVPAFLAEGRVAGVIVKGPNQGELPAPADNELLRAIYRVPHVWMMGRLPNALGDHCNFDAEMAGRLAAEHVTARGHRRVAFLNPKPGHAQFEHMKRAFCERSRALGAEAEVLEHATAAPLAWPLPGMTSPERVEELARQWHATPKSRRATAIMVGADMTAVQLYHSLGRIGVAAGRDVGIVSCNDERSLTAGLNPGLSTLDVRADAIGRNALARLLWQARQSGATAPAKILVEPVLVERESVPAL